MFLSHLAQSLKISASTQNQALNAIAFLYHQVLQHALPDFGSFPRAKRPKHLPTVFSPSEVQKVLENLTGTEHLMACLLYGSSLRLTECTCLRVKDLDFVRRVIMVRNGKGEKDRVTIPKEDSLSAVPWMNPERLHISLKLAYAIDPPASAYEL